MSCGSAFTIDSSDLVLGAILARGALGVTVYTADLKMGQQSLKVAVKRLPTHGAPLATEQVFLKEMQTLRLVSGMCQRACRLIGCSKIDGDACIVMSLYPKSATQRLDETEGPLLLPEVLALSIEILEGLAQLHAAHILHLDLKPGNILLDDYGHAYLSDFGISQAIRTLETCTVITSPSGTPHYMAPEQTDAEFGTRGPHTDVWGFAATVLHLATGQLPYAGLSQIQMVSAMFRKRSPEVPATLPGWLRKALQQCLSFGTAARPSVAGLHQLFENQAKQAHTAFIQPGAEVEANVPAVTSQTPQAQPVSPTQQHSLQPSGRTGAVQKSQNVSSAPTSRGSSELEQQVYNQQLMCAACHGDLELAREALSQGADINYRGMHEGQTPLMMVDNPALAELLLEAGADTAARDTEGRTPLMYASVRGLYGETSQRTLAIVKLLLCNGANIAARDDMGDTALDYATKMGQTEFAELLKKHQV